MITSKRHLLLLIVMICFPISLFCQLPKRGNNGLWGYVDTTGNWIVNPQFTEVDRFSEGLAKVSIDGINYGFIELDGKWAITSSQDLKYAREFKDGVSVIAAYGEKRVVIDRKGNVLFKTNLRISDFENGVAFADWGVCIDKSGKRVPVPYNFEYYKLEHSKKGNGFIIKGADGTKSKEFTGRTYCSYGIGRVLINGLVPHVAGWPTEGVGFMNKYGSWVITPSYLEVTPFDKDGHAIVLTQDQELVIIDKTGEICAELTDYTIPIPYKDNYGSWNRGGAYSDYGLRDDGIATLQIKKSSNIVYVYKSDLMGTHTKELVSAKNEQDDVTYTKDVQQDNTENITTSTIVDVDSFIPKVSRINETTFVVIIANEEYRRVENVKFALNDGRVFKAYCQNTLGVPQENIHIVENATLNDIRAEINWMLSVAEAYNGAAKFIFYYAGHGIPDEKTQTSYLLPVDGYGTDTETGYKLAELYEKFNVCPANSIVVFLDACFSGSQRGENMLASARGVAIKPKPESPSGNVVVFSAATGDETAYPYEDKSHGLFTYFLLKKMQDSNGNITLGELGDYLMENVSRTSIVRNSKSQTPTVTPSSAMPNWFNMKL